MSLSIICALAANRVIGRMNRLPWHLPEDLAYFKKATFGRPVIMGRKTFDSIIKILGKPLPGRKNIIISRTWEQKDLPLLLQQGKLQPHSDCLADYLAACLILPSLEAAEPYFKGKDKAQEAFLIGGAELYAQAMDLADRLYITKIDQDFDGDAYFPQIDPLIWQETHRETHRAAPPNDFDFSFLVYKRNAES